MDDIRTIKETAADLGLHYEVVRIAITTLGITPKPVPRNGNAKGLDKSDRKRIAQMFKRDLVSA